MHSEKRDTRLYFTVSMVLDQLEHFKRTEQYINTISFSHVGVCGLPLNEGKQHARVKSRQCCGGNIHKLYLLSEYASCMRAFFYKAIKLCFMLILFKYDVFTLLTLVER